ncbi:hypothetical protein A7S23_18035 [Salmonella enterica]|nr:hypothetical protein A7S79_11570 [Salmonella enterica]OHG74537.1 hypothetical protein A7T36_11250 [Salmonella enterica subsp. enterica serovar Muenchen]OHM17990.1 hypothetical protein A7T19_13670 [Salmonella enterica subsp. enterica serovar Inverness]PUO64674.1 hypothetical protein DAY05_16570 [Salmonella enterica subsp. enterica]RII61760.1 hypothetical protein BUJ39_0011625 [Salmonella enterica subsp. diarizonae serovar 16:z10:e,n,x,z15]
MTRFPDKCLSHRLQWEKFDLKRISVSVFQGVRTQNLWVERQQLIKPFILNVNIIYLKNIIIFFIIGGY